MPRHPEVYDAFLVNGHFACVVHVGEHVVLIRVFADPMTYAMHVAHAQALIEAFSKMATGDMRS
jgi:hypothetical protein